MDEELKSAIQLKYGKIRHDKDYLRTLPTEALALGRTHEQQVLITSILLRQPRNRQITLRMIEDGLYKYHKKLGHL